MPVSCIDCLSELLCGEDSAAIFSEDEVSAAMTAAECSSEAEAEAPLWRPVDVDESIDELMEAERNYVPGTDYAERFRSLSLDASAREESVAWILRVHRYYGFKPLTAYLSINYFDRFLCSHRLPQTRGWPLQLLSVACLSLAAKMEEPLVPSLLELQVEGAKYVFEPKTICRMEFLVLSVLDWRLRSVTPFNFIGFFAYKIDPTGTYTGFLIARAVDIIFSIIQEASFLEYWPSCIAAATMLCAANELPSFSLVNPELAESWCDGLRKEKITSCYQLVQEIVTSIRARRPSKALPQIRVSTRAGVTSSESSTSSSSSSSSSYKRRKLNNNNLWTDDSRGSSE